MKHPFVFTYQPLDSTYYSKKEDELERLEKIISTDFYANAISTLAIILTIAIFIRQNYINNKDRKKETKKNWYMSVIIQPNLNNIDKFYNQIHQRINNNINTLKGITDGRFIQRQKARANRTLRDLRNDFLDNFVTIVQSYDKSLATKINKTINDLQDLCSQQIDNYSNTDISQIKKKIYENRASLISLLYEGIKEEKEKWYKRIFKWRRR
jgi:cell division protein FtsX